MDSLIKVQIDIKQKISGGQANFKKSPKVRITKSYIETRIEQLEKQWTQFETNHFEIVGKDSGKEELSYLKNNVYDLVEDLYITYKVELKESLLNFQNLSTHTHTSSCPPRDMETTSVKLPKIVLPSFSGQYIEWQTFHDLFDSLIHKNSSLANVQKLHYLKSHLTGEAEQLLRNIPITEANYETCWMQLKQRYSNKRHIANCILSRLVGQKTLSMESSNGIKQILDTTNDCLNASALKQCSSLGIDVSTWDILVIYLVSLKFDSETRKQWEQKISEFTDIFPTLNELKTFLESRFRALEYLEPSRKIVNLKEKIEKSKVFKVTTVSCSFCAEGHMLHQCKKFCKESYRNRYEFVQKQRLCFNCFGDSHMVFKCKRNTKCNRCGRRHHSLLHPEEGNDGSPLNVVCNPTETYQHKNDVKSTTNVGQVISNYCSVSGHVVLATAIVRVFNSKNECYFLRALLDQGSQASFITEHCAQMLGLRKSKMRGVVSGLGGGNSHTINYAVHFKIQSTSGQSFERNVQAYVLKSLSSNLPVKRVDIQDWPQFSKLELADPGFGTPSKIDLLLGAEVFAQILKNGVVHDPSGQLMAQNTKLGWILSGRVQLPKIMHDNVISLHIQDDSLNQLIRSFWEIETEPPVKILSDEDQTCENFYESTTTRDLEGRYVVRLPFREKDPPCQYGSLREIALRRFNFLEKKLNKNSLLKEEYCKAMNDYISQGHMKLIHNYKELSQANCVYLPHHAVVREDKTTTKVRVVFDASCKGRNGISLNNDLLVGPRLQPELRHILLRWRTYPICLVADIIKMYRQIKVSGDDATKYQRLLWRFAQDEEIKEYKMSRVTFGVSSAPYLAIKTLQQIAKDEGKDYELAAFRVLNDFYMDDLMSGCEDENQAVEIYTQMTELLSKGGFVLQKWASNSNRFMEKIKDERRNVQLDNAKLDNGIKILGLYWDVSLDSFRYKISLPEMKQPVTKRTVLSDIARLFDPLGWTAPVVIRAKIYMQRLWLAGVAWDEVLNAELLREWIAFREELPALNQFVIPRWMHTRKDVKETTLHGFCDASNDAYAAVVYSRTVDSCGRIYVTLLAARTKVAPLKQISIPRLELCGAELLASLLSEIADVLGFSRSQFRAWTDSTIVLAWLKGEPNRWKTFVANRVTKILTVIDNEQWSHIESAHNPADCASRGLKASDCMKHDLWLRGPNWLRDCQYPNPHFIIPQTNIEEKSIKVYTIMNDQSNTITDLKVWNKYSSCKKLVRVIAWCRRFLSKCKNSLKILPPYLTLDELDSALNLCLIHCQKSAFSDEIDRLKNLNVISKKSRLKSLCPFIDAKGIMRAKGRIQHSDLEYTVKHPIILPSGHHVSKLIIGEAHEKTLHGGLQLMLNYLRSNYWILNVKSMIKQHIKRCGKCVKYRATTQQPFMGDLPKARVTMSRPFSHCGIDYAGPINVRLSKGRGCRSYKGYICLIVCMATRAIHLEAVSDMTTEGFLSAFKRFVARRGHCHEVFSDNGTNFVGASKELQKLFKIENASFVDEVAESLANIGTKWSFIPPHSPNFGGLWEAGVKSTKFHLRRVLDGTTLTYEELSTVLAQVEACLNSRPLYQMTSNSDEPIALTPGHFLIGEAPVTVPDFNYIQTHVGSLRRWQFTQRLVQHFWRRWSQEYLTTLLQRNKWAKITPEPSCGDVVLVKEDDLPPSKWLLGIISETHPGPDNITRVVTLKCKNGKIKRPVSKLCILPTTKE